MSLEIVGAMNHSTLPSSQLNSATCHQKHGKKHDGYTPSSLSSSPVSVVAPLSSESENPLFDVARKAAISTFPATLGKMYLYRGAKVRFHNVSFGGDDSVVCSGETTPPTCSQRKL